MPEGDTVWLTAHRLDQALRDREVTRFEMRVPQLATADLRGDTVLEVVARGKHLLTRFRGGLTLHSHLRMDGSWYLAKHGTKPRRHPMFMIRAVIANADWSATGYRIHDLHLLPSTQEDQWVGHLGPDVLGADWDRAVAAERILARPDREIGEALVDQTNLAGIGNMYKAEVLFIEGVNPWTSAGNVPDLDRMLATCHRLLRANRDHPEQSTTGMIGRNREHWVYARLGEACLRCGTPIARAEQGEPPRQRTTYWCPTCQPGEPPAGSALR